jgi:hypothetical protein
MENQANGAATTAQFRNPTEETKPKLLKMMI